MKMITVSEPILDDILWILVETHSCHRCPIGNTCDFNVQLISDCADKIKSFLSSGKDYGEK